jgi:hypothetical protein
MAQEQLGEGLHARKESEVRAMELAQQEGEV